MFDHDQFSYMFSLYLNNLLELNNNYHTEFGDSERYFLNEIEIKKPIDRILNGEKTFRIISDKKKICSIQYCFKDYYHIKDFMVKIYV